MPLHGYQPMSATSGTWIFWKGASRMWRRIAPSRPGKRSTKLLQNPRQSGPTAASGERTTPAAGGAKKAERAEDQWPVAWQVHFVLLAGCLHSFAELLYVSTGRFCLYCDSRSGMLGNLARLDSTASLTACPSPFWSEPRKAGTVSLSG